VQSQNLLYVHGLPDHVHRGRIKNFQTEKMSAPQKLPSRHFKVDARALISLGRESIKDHTTALVELVKNAYDADADNVEIEIVSRGRPASDYIRIADDGHGMAERDIDENWLRIGYSIKRKQKQSKKGRRETGEKGIGRLSADRLGASLELRSKKSGAAAVGVSVNWDQFDVDGREVANVPITNIADPKPTFSKREKAGVQTTGTEIIIHRLRQPWTQDDFDVLRSELSTLVPAGVSKSAFSIWQRKNDDVDFEKLESTFNGQAQLMLVGKFDRKGILSYQITARPSDGASIRPVVKKSKISWEQLTPSKLGKAFELGPFEVRLSFFLRAAVSLEEGLTLARLREYLDSDGGVKIYRDDIRVKPYGDPTHAEGDWLGLSVRKTMNPAGAGRADFRISANQLVGAVLISRDANSALVDSAAREGLIHSNSFNLLRAAVFGCVELLEGVHHERHLQKKTEAELIKAPKLPTVVSELKTTLSEVSKDLEAANSAPTTRSSSALLRGTVEKIELAVERVEQAEREIEELASQNTIYRGLATVGIAAAVFGHETESSLAQSKLSTSTARRLLSIKNARIDEALEEILKAEKSISKVELWGQFALARLKKDKRRRTKFDMARAVSGLAGEIRPLFEASKIELREEIEQPLEIRAFSMDIESLVLNLLTNAYHAAIASPKNRKILIQMDSVVRGSVRYARLRVADSGPGIASEYIGRIWDPLFSTKVDNKGRPVGTGLGLTIVKSVARDMDATLTASPKGPLGGAAFEVQFPMVK
jgi:signal transduction histidine kinase